jgi:transcriptional regulator with XRE-family HTH domain
LVKRLDLPSVITQSNVSAYERGTKEPPVIVLMKYAELANVWSDVLVNDSLDLPEQFPTKTKSEGIRRKKPRKPDRP